jgi:hypothetical protein
MRTRPPGAVFLAIRAIAAHRKERFGAYRPMRARIADN